MNFVDKVGEYIQSYSKDYFMTNSIKTAMENLAVIPKIKWDKESRNYCRDSVTDRMKVFRTKHIVTRDSIMDAVANSPRDSIVLCYGDFYSPGGKYYDKPTQEQILLLNTGLYEILDSFRIRYYLPHHFETNKGMFCHSCIMSMGVPYYHNGLNGLTNVINSSAVDFSNIKNIYKSEKQNYYDKGVAVMMERQEFVYIMAASTGATTFIAGPWGCGKQKNNAVNVAKGWLDCEMKNPGLFKQVIHPMGDNKSAYYVFKDILCEEA